MGSRLDKPSLEGGDYLIFLYVRLVFLLTKVHGISREVMALGTLSKSLRLALIRVPEVDFPQNETLRMHVGCIQP